MIPAVSAMTSVLSELQSLADGIVAPSVTGPGAAGRLVPDVDAPADADAPSFAAALRGALGTVDSSIAEAGGKAKAFAAGDKDIPLSDVMVSLEQASLSLQLAAGVRDKVVAAYTNVMNMQV
jgi:flagellar hook-basal body complex protein FliE